MESFYLFDSGFYLCFLNAGKLFVNLSSIFNNFTLKKQIIQSHK